MRQLFWIVVAIAAVMLASCKGSEAHLGKKIDDAEVVMSSNTDSAMSMLDAIDPSELTTDSIRAKYHYLKAYGHMRQNRSMIADSLVAVANQYYRGKDLVRGIRSGYALAYYKFWVGDTPGALSMLDSLANLPDVPDSLMVQTLRIRSLLGASEYQGAELVPVVKRLYALETDSLRKQEAKYILLSAYEYAQQMDSALLLIDDLIRYATSHRWGDKQFMLELEKAQILGEMGRTRESDALVDGIFRKSSPDNGAADILYIQYAINALNSGNPGLASRHLAVADSMAVKLGRNEDTYYRSYSNLLHAMIDFSRSGKMKLAHINGVYNRQQEHNNRIKASQWESERGALLQESRALALKAESEHKTVLILVIVFVSLLLLLGAGWMIRQRRQRELENEERAEALQKMVDELKSAPAPKETDTSTPSALRRAMLQQLGIIKMVAETPTAENRDMLRKISSIDSDTKGELVNWPTVFEVINNLYSGFYDKLHSQYGSTLTPKEEQIIVLMMADFSTKEISVITGQTTSTIYVRKSSIRKKLGVPEKEDILLFLQDHLTR